MECMIRSGSKLEPLGCQMEKLGVAQVWDLELGRGRLRVLG
jgi:hypothetical protein